MWVLLFVLGFWAVMLCCLYHQVHFFQLNSYKPKVHLERELENQRQRFIFAAVSLLVIPAFLILKDGWKYAISALIFFVSAGLSFPKKAKKKLVFTNRVLRMAATMAVILLIVPVLFIVLGKVRWLFACIMAALPVLSVFVLLAANKINAPIEKAINDGFIREAREIIDGDRQLTVIGVTGSYGKTSLKFFLGKLLSMKYTTLITPESYNTTLGVVRTVRENLKPIHEFFVCEMGARNVGDIKEICDIVSPHFGVITSVGEQHLESFKTLENIVNTKFELADSLCGKGKLFVNMDSEPARKNAAKYPNVIGYGSGIGCDYRVSDVRVSEKGSEFTITAPDGSSASFETKLLGEHNVINITGAVAVAHTMGVKMESLVAGVRRLEAVEHRLQLIRTGRGIMIDDAYNSNPNGAKAALNVLRGFDAQRILVTPGMVELGEKQYECNFEFGRQAAQAADLVVLVGEKQTKPIYDGLLDAGYSTNNIIVTEELFKGIAEAEKVPCFGKQRVFLLENDLPDNY